MEDKLLELLNMDELRFLVFTMNKEINSLRKAMIHLETNRELIEEKEILFQTVSVRISNSL